MKENYIDARNISSRAQFSNIQSNFFWYQENQHVKTALPPFLRRDQWVRDLRVDPINKLVVCIIATHVDCEFVCRTNTKTLVEECGISRQRYSEAISTLSKAGLIFVNKNRRGGRWECNSSVVLCVGHAPSHVAHDDTYHVVQSDTIEENQKEEEEEKNQTDFKKPAEETTLEDSGVSIPTASLKILGPEKTQTGTSSPEDSHPHCAAPLSQVFAPQPVTASEVMPPSETDVEPVTAVEPPLDDSPAVQPDTKLPWSTPVDKGAAILQAYRCAKPSTQQIVQYWLEMERHYMPKAAARRLKKKQGKGPLYNREFFPLMKLFERTYKNAEPAFELVHKVFSKWAAIRDVAGAEATASTHPTPTFIADNHQLLWSHLDEGLFDDVPDGSPKLHVTGELTGGGVQFLTPDGKIDHAALAENLAAKFAA